MANDALDGLTLVVGGDITPLDEAFAQIPAAAQTAAQQVSNAFAGAGQDLSGLGDIAGQLDNDWHDLAGAAGEAGAAVHQIPEEFQHVSEESGNATEKLQEFLEKGLELAGITLTLEAIKEALVEAVSEFGDFQRAGESLAVLTGNAEAAAGALERIPALANKLGQSIPSLENTQQQLLRFGMSLQAIPAALQTISDASRVANASFDTTASVLERIANSGQLSLRTLQNSGITLEQLGRAMDMPNASAAELSTALRKLGTDADAVSQRWQILEAATQSFADISEKTANDVKGSWQQIENAIHEASVQVGASLSLLGSAGVSEAIKVVVDGVATLVIGVSAGLGAVITAVTAFVKFLTASFVGVGQAIADAAKGDFAKAWQDLSQGGTDAMNALEQGGEKMVADFTANGKILNDIWSGTADSATESSGRITTSINVANMAVQAQAKAFAQVAAAYAEGKATAADYTKALEALNVAQMTANNGIQQAATALLLIENSYRQLGVAAINAATNLRETVAAIDAGQGSWTQYVAALQAANKAQEELSGGLQSFAMASALADAAFEQLLIDGRNAETTFEAVALQYDHGNASAKQYADALRALDAAQRALNGGLEEFHTAVLLAVEDQRQLQVAAANALTALEAQAAVYDQTGQGLTKLLDLTNKYVKAQEDASNGVISWVAANLQIAASETEMQVHLANANTLLAQAKQLFEDGAISAGTYQKYLDSASKAQDALTGTTKSSVSANHDAAASHNSLSSAVNGVAASFKVATGAILSQQDAVVQVANHYRDLQVNLVNARTWLQAVQDGYDKGQASATMLVGALNGLIKAQQEFGGATTSSDASVASQINTLRNLAGATDPAANGLLNIGTAALNAAANVGSATSSIDANINSIAQDAFQATQALDGFFNSLSSGMQKSGDLNLQAKVGDVITQTINGVSHSTTVGTPEELIKLHEQQMQAVAALLASTNTLAAATTKSAAASGSLATSATDLSNSTVSLVSTAADLGATVSDVGTVVDAAAATVQNAVVAVNTAVTTATLGSAIISDVIAAINGSPSNTTSPLSLGSLPSLTPNLPDSGLQGANTMLGTGGGTGYYSPYVGGAAPVTLNVNVTGNTITNAAAAQQLANTIMATAVSKLRTQAGLKINV